MVGVKKVLVFAYKLELLFSRFLNFTNSYQITQTKPIIKQVINCDTLSVSNSKKAVKGGMNSNSPVMETVINIISKTI